MSYQVHKDEAHVINGRYRIRVDAIKRKYVHEMCSSTAIAEIYRATLQCPETFTQKDIEVNLASSFENPKPTIARSLTRLAKRGLIDVVGRNILHGARTFRGNKQPNPFGSTKISTEDAQNRRKRRLSIAKTKRKNGLFAFSRKNDVLESVDEIGGAFNTIELIDYLRNNKGWSKFTTGGIRTNLFVMLERLVNEEWLVVVRNRGRKGNTYTKGHRYGS